MAALCRALWCAAARNPRRPDLAQPAPKRQAPVRGMSRLDGNHIGKRRRPDWMAGPCSTAVAGRGRTRHPNPEFRRRRRVFEGWAANLEEADQLIASGEYALAAQEAELGPATPLTAVVSPSMQVLVMEDLAGQGKRAYPARRWDWSAPPAARPESPEALDLLRFLHETVAPAIAPAAADDPVPWLSIVDEA